MRLDIYIAKYKNISRQKAQELIKKGGVLVNGREEKSSYVVEEGDEICQLIRDTFNEMKISMDLSPFNILDSSRWNIMRTLEIDFRAKKTPFLTA